MGSAMISQPSATLLLYNKGFYLEPFPWKNTVIELHAEPSEIQNKEPLERKEKEEKKIRLHS